MAKKNEIEKVVGSKLEAPKFMQETALACNDALKEYIIPSRIKVVQQSSAAELISVYNAGDVILVPTLEVVAAIPTNDKGKWNGERGKFYVTPIFFYPEWVTWNPLETRGREASIRERTVDKNHPLVSKCRNFNSRTEPHPQDMKLKIEHREHLNFLCMAWSDVFHTVEPVVLSFSKTSHAAGTKLASLIRARKAPLYGCVFEIGVIQSSNEKGNWFTFEANNPSEGSAFVENQETFEMYKSMNAEFSKLHQEALIRVAYDEPAEVTPVGDTM